jgi:DNA-binding CsgD family transcriptional regulator
MSATTWHAHAADVNGLDDNQRPMWSTLAADATCDWSWFCPFDYYSADLRRMMSVVQLSECHAEEVARRSCALPGSGPHEALAWLAVRPDGACECIEFLKCASVGPFTLRDEAVLRILSTELLARPARAPQRAEQHELSEFAELPRRQREVLSWLLAGASVKEIACELGISPYTVNDYIKALYRRFHVSSRGELMAALHGLRRPALPK